MTYINSIGTANPSTNLRQEEIGMAISQMLDLPEDDARKLDLLYRRSGIENRQTVIDDFDPSLEPVFFKDKRWPKMGDRMELYKKLIPPLAIQAVDNCFSKVEAAPKELTHLITCSSTGFYSPGLDIELIAHYGLKAGTRRTCVNNMGCCGAINALQMADAIVSSQPEAKVLVVCIELTTIHFRESREWSELVSNSLFGDGAAAVLVTGEPLHERAFEISDFYTVIDPDDGRDVSWYMKNDGFEVNLSTYVPQLVESGIGKLVSSLLKENHLKREDIAVFAIHPGGRKILEVCEKELKLSEEDSQYSRKVLREHGNMSSPSILFVLNEISQNGQMTPGNHVMGIAFGPGLALESMLLKVPS